MSLSVYLTAIQPVEVYEANITHNLIRMAIEAGVYDALWEPKESGYDNAADLIEPLRSGLAQLESESERFKQFNPKNGWGDYDGLVRFVRSYLEACIENPDAKVSTIR